MSNLHPLFQKIVGAFAPETAEQKNDREMAADGWKPHVFNGVKSYMRQSTTPGPRAEDGGAYCARCDHFYVGESRCPRH
jgi:hypothetical protein